MARLIVVVISAVCLFVLSSADGSLGGRSGAPANLTDYGRTVWNLEALLRDTFGPKEVWLQYRGQITPKAAWNWSRPVKWCARLSASSSPDGQAAAAMAITSSGCSSAGVSTLAMLSALM